MPEGIGYSAARAIAKMIMPGFINLGLGGNAIINMLRDRGITYRRQTMLEDIREYSGMMKREAAVRAVDSAVLFPQWPMVETTLKRDRPYRIFGNLTLEDPYTWERKTVRVSFYADERRSKDEWINEFISRFPESTTVKGNVITDMELTSVWHMRGYGYY